jgi:hypothetical protein
MKFKFQNLTVYKKAKDFHNQEKAVVAQQESQILRESVVIY